MTQPPDDHAPDAAVELARRIARCSYCRHDPNVEPDEWTQCPGCGGKRVDPDKLAAIRLALAAAKAEGAREERGRCALECDKRARLFEAYQRSDGDRWLGWKLAAQQCADDIRELP